MPLVDLRQNSRLGFKRQSPLAPYMPDESQVEAAAQEQDKPALIWRLLQVPERLLGGQMIKGFAEGLGKGGIGEGLWEAFRNNPINQILEALPGVDGLVQDTSFAQVRKAWGGTDTDEGIGNFLINTAGDILMSPFELMWNPFGRLVSAGEKATAIAKGEANIGKAVFSPIAKGGPAALADAVIPNDSGIRRMLFAFKIPFTQDGFAFKAPANMDVHFAKQIDHAAAWLNTNPATKAILDNFTRAKLRVSDATQRLFGNEARMNAEKIKRLHALNYTQMMSGAVETAAKMGVEFSPSENAAIQFLSDYSIDHVDENLANVYRAIDDGVEVSAAKARTRRMFEAQGPSLPQDVGPNQFARDLANKFASPNRSDFDTALTKWQKEFGNAALPQQFYDSPFYEESKHLMRPGIDVARPEYVPAEQRIAATVNEPLKGPDGRVIVEGQGVPTPEFAAVEQARAVRGEFRDSVKSIFEGIINDKGTGQLQKLADVKTILEGISNRFNLAEDAAGVMNRIAEPYLPRDMHPAAREMMGARIADFTKGRVNKDSSVLELNLWITRFGSKATGFAAKTPEEILGRMFPESFMKSIKSAAMDGDERFRDLASFMLVNPVYAVYKRAQKSLGVLEKASFIGAIHDAESPLVQVRTKISDVADNAKHKAAGMRDVLWDKTRVLGTKQMASGAHVEDAMNLNNAGRKLEFDTQFADHASHVLDRVAGKMGPNQGGPAVLDRTLHIFDTATRLDVNDLDQAAIGSKNIVPSEIADHPLVRNLRRQAEITEQTSGTRIKKDIRFEPIITEGTAINPKTDDLVLSQKKPLGTETTGPIEGQAFTETKNVTDRPGRKVKPIKKDANFVIGALDRFRQAYFKEDPALRARLGQAIEQYQFWAKKSGIAPIPISGPESFIEQSGLIKTLEMQASVSDDAEGMAPILQSLYDSKSAVDDARKVLQDQFGAATEEVISKGGEVARRTGEAQSLDEAIDAFRSENRASRRHGEAAKQIIETVKTNPFLKSLVDSEHAFQTSNRVGQLNKLRVEEETMRRSMRDQLAGWKEHRAALTDAANATLKGRKDLVNSILSDLPHGADMVTEFQVMLEQSKKGALPMQRLDDIFTQRAAQMNRDLPIGKQPVDPATLKAEWLAKHPDSEIHWMQPDVFEGVYGKNGMVDRMFSPSSMSNMFQRFGAFTSWWKAATVLPPVYLRSRMRDQMVNVLSVAQGTGAVAGLAEHSDAYQIGKTVRDFMAGKRDAADALRVPLGVAEDGAPRFASAADVISNLAGNGVISTGGLARDEISMMLHEIPGFPQYTGEGTTVMQKIQRSDPTQTWWGKPGAKFAEFLDNQSKIASVLAFARKHNVDLDTASAAIKRFVYDPGSMDVSNVEKYLFSKVMPFYKYSKFAIESQVDSFFRKPGTVTWFEKAHQNANRASGLSEAEINAFMPDFVQTNLGIPIAKRPDGLQVQLFGTFLPIGEVTRLAQSITDSFDRQKPTGLKDYIGGNLNPFIRLPIETAINRSFFTQRPVERYAGEKGEIFGVALPVAWRNALVSLRFLNELDNMNALNFGDVEQILASKGAVDRKQYAETDLIDRLLATSLSPVPFGKPYFLNSEQQSRVKQGQYDAEMNDLKHQLKIQIDRGNPTTSADNIKTLQALMAASIAKQQAALSAAQKLGN